MFSWIYDCVPCFNAIKIENMYKAVAKCELDFNSSIEILNKKIETESKEYLETFKELKTFELVQHLCKETNPKLLEKNIMDFNNKQKKRSSIYKSFLDMDLEINEKKKHSSGQLDTMVPSGTKLEPEVKKALEFMVKWGELAKKTALKQARICLAKCERHHKEITRMTKNMQNLEEEKISLLNMRDNSGIEKVYEHFLRTSTKIRDGGSDIDNSHKVAEDIEYNEQMSSETIDRYSRMAEQRNDKYFADFNFDEELKDLQKSFEYEENTINNTNSQKSRNHHKKKNTEEKQGEKIMDLQQNTLDNLKVAIPMYS